jgi:chromosome partitioning protein
LIGVTDAYLRRLSIEGKGPAVEVGQGGRRSYTIEDLNELRRYLAQITKGDRNYLPHRARHEHLQVITVVNFKGGSGKTTTAAHLAQYLALRGYRVLALDLDPQASLSALHGLQPEFDVGENETLYGAIRYDGNRRDLSQIIRPTYFTNLDLVPGNLELMEFNTKRRVRSCPAMKIASCSSPGWTQRSRP